MRYFILFFILLISVFRVESQTDGCDYTGGIGLTVGGSCSNVTFNSDDNTKYWTSPSGCNAGNRDDKWRWFTATYTTTIIKYTPESGRDAVLHVFSAACGANMVALACSDGGGDGVAETITLPTIVGQKYSIRIQRFNHDGNINGDICVYSLIPPSNDEPCSATALTVGSSCTYAIYTNVNATATTGITAPACASYSGGDVWFTATVPANGILKVNTNTGTVTNSGMAFYTGTCGSLTFVECDDDDSENGNMSMITRTGLTPGSTVWIRVWEYGNDANGTFSICAQEIVTVANDEPCTATALTVGASCSYTAFTTVNATTTAGVTAPGCASYSGGDVWFTALVPASGILSIDTQTGGITDGGMAVYTGTCGALTLLECDDDDSDNGTMSKIERTGLTPGSTVWIRFWEFGNDFAGTFSICVYSTAVPVNDNCSGAIALTPGATCSYTAGTSAGATQSMAGCTGTADDDVWFQFTATQTSHLVTVDGAASYDAVAQIFSGTCGGTLTSIQCRNLTSTDGIESTAISGLTIGQPYFVRVYHQGAGATATPTFNICISMPIPNDNCEGAITLVPGVGSTCSYTSGTTSGATQSLDGCTGNADDDVWYKFIATSTSHQVTVDGGTNFNAVLQLYSGSCASLSSLNCNNLTGQDGIETSTLNALTVGQTYYIRIHHSTAGSSTSDFQVCITSIANFCNIGTTVPVTLPYSASGLTNCGSGNDITSSNVTNICGDYYYYTGEDAVYTFTPAVTGSITVAMTSTSTYAGVTLYNGCPISGGICTASSQSTIGNQSFCANVVAGAMYYLVVDSWSSPYCHPSYTLSVTAPSAAGASGATCATAVDVTLPYNATTQSTSCMGNDYTNASIGSCGTFYESGEDKVYKFTTTGAQCMSLELSNVSSSSIGYQVYSGCPGTTGTACVASGGEATSGTLTGSFSVPAAGTYYLVIDSWSTPFNVNYDISFNVIGSSPLNDLPCNAIGLTLGNQISGDNSCSGSAGEVTSTGCWTSGSINSIWYSVVVPATGSVKIKTNAGSLFDTQIKVYSGTCSSLTEIGCNNDAADCGYNETAASELSLTGLAAGSTIFIRVDGADNTTGSFSLIAINGTLSYPASPGQDCGLPNPVCNQNLTVSNPGYNGYGNSCDLPVSYCLEDGERNVVWYTLPMNATGTLSFDIIPNDFNCSLLEETDYDFAVWKLDTDCDAGAADGFCCTEIFSGSATPISCNYDGQGVTGMGTGGNPPTSLTATVCPTCVSCPSYNPSLTYSSAYEPSIAVASGEMYVIAISNYSNSTSGFRVDFKATPIDYTAGTNTGGVTWSGGDLTTPSIWTDVDNWGGCSAPSCTRDAFIAAFANQPALASGIVYSGKDVTIQAGATLTLNANSTLELCGDFINYGNLDMHPTATIRFVGNDLQNLSGNLSGSNRLGNLVVLKTDGQVNLLNHVEIGGNFTTSDNTSIFNTNSNAITLAGNFSNFNGNTTYTTTGVNGTLEFNGSGTQLYNQGASQLDLNFVLLNNTAAAGSGVTLNTDINIKSLTGKLTLNQGTITTGTNKVDVANTSANAVTAGTVISYVDGNLRRYLGATGSYEWPVGNVSKGYQRATTAFTSCSIGYLDARFDLWPSTPPIQGGTECAMTYSIEAENNGYWTLTANAGTGNYNMTLYPLNATNTTGMSGWSIMKKPSVATGAWTMNGNCIASTATVVNRNNMTGFSIFGVAQSVTPLPIELLSFSGRSEETSNFLEWITATEINNDYFTLERSANGYEFLEFAIVDAAGNSSTQINYSKYDYSPYSGITYYRLKQTDYNGLFSYSNTIALTNKLDEISMGNVYPNPTSGDVSFDFFSPVNGNFSLKMMDNTGRIVMDKQELITQDRTKINLMMNSLAKGVYTLEVHFDKTEFTSVVKVVKN